MAHCGDERYVIYVVPGADERQHSFRRYRTVAAALLVSVAVLALAALSRGSAQKVEMTSQLGKLGAAMEDRELAALASVKNPYRIKQQSLVVKNGKSVQQLAWKNAGAVADPNVFNHPVEWFAPDDPARPTPSPVSKKEYSADLKVAGGLEIVHSTDNGSPVGDSFKFSRASDDTFHGSAPSPPPPAATTYFTMPKGKTVTVVAPTENGQSGTYKEFDFDTTADDFFTHHPPK